MTFTENDKLKALAIVHIFETSRPFGDYAACVVLNDGAGVSYGINQFTHRSGSLAAVVDKYLKDGGQIGKDILGGALAILKKKTATAINQLAGDERFKKALRSAAHTAEMQAAQNAVAFTRYLRPALHACNQLGFVSPLSLAVVYDSVTHGSWEYIAGRVHVSVKSDDEKMRFEKSWITEYVRIRHRWLTDIRRLKATTYRTKFFLGQIAIGNWDLKLPMTVHGVRLTERMFPPTVLQDLFSTAAESPTADTSILGSAKEKDASASESGAIATGFPAATDGRPDEVPPVGTSMLESATELASAASQKFDRVDGVITAVVTRKDAAKSLWTTVAGTLWQAAWGVFGFIVGLPRIVWIVVAVIAATLMLLYLYRQIVLGRIRETQN